MGFCEKNIKKTIRFFARKRTGKSKKQKNVVAKYTKLKYGKNKNLWTSEIQPRIGHRGPQTSRKCIRTVASYSVGRSTSSSFTVNGRLIRHIYRNHRGGRTIFGPTCRQALLGRQVRVRRSSSVLRRLTAGGGCAASRLFAVF